MVILFRGLNFLILNLRLLKVKIFNYYQQLQLVEICYYFLLIQLKNN